MLKHKYLSRLMFYNEIHKYRDQYMLQAHRLHLTLFLFHAAGSSVIYALISYATEQEILCNTLFGLCESLHRKRFINVNDTNYHVINDKLLATQLMYQIQSSEKKEIPSCLQILLSPAKIENPRFNK